MKVESFTEIEVAKGDLPYDYLKGALNSGIVALDLETSGLDWKKDRIATCQLYTPALSVMIVRIGKTIPGNLKLLLAEASVRKVFHHAMFDLRFMAYHWQVSPESIACTKIASKLLDPGNRSEHSLKPLLKNYIGVEIDKTQQLSNWLSRTLSKEQLTYAALDVVYLLPLFSTLRKELEIKGLWDLATACFAHLPTRVQLDLLGFQDVYAY